MNKIEKKQNFNTVTPKLHTMTHDFLFRNVYKKQKPLSDEKRNHPSSHYRYKFHHSNTNPNLHKNKKWKKRQKIDVENDSDDQKMEKKELSSKQSAIPFYDDTQKPQKKYFSDDELDICESSESSDNELSFDHFRKDSLKRKHLNRKINAKSKWLQSKILQNAAMFEGGLDLQGRVPENALKKKKSVMKGALVLGAIHSVHQHYAKVYLYGSIPAILTIREVSDVLSAEIDHLIAPSTNKKLSDIRESLSMQSLKQNALKKQQKAFKRDVFYYESLADLPNMHKMFRRNQIIRCIVTHSDESGQHVSLRTSLFNSKLRMNDLICGYSILCAIKSVQEKGYVIDTGIFVQDKGGENEISVRAFMNYKDVPIEILRKLVKNKNERDFDEDNHKIPIGFPLELVVKKSDLESNAIWLTLDFKKYFRELSQLPIVPLAALKPGFCVQCNVKRKLSDALIVEFCKVYQGVVSYSHMDKLLAENWQKCYKIGQEISARIVLIHPKTNVIHLSIKPHLAQTSNLSFLPNALSYSTDIPRRNNEILTADVRRIAYDSLYLYCKLLDPEHLNKEKNKNKNDDDDKSDVDEEEKKLFPALNSKPLLQMIPIRIPPNHLGVKGSLSNPKIFDQWKNRKNLKVKLLRFDAFVGEFQGTLKQSEVEAQVLFYKHVKYGMVFECKVTGMDLQKQTVNVSFANGLLGHISILHIAEHPPKSLEEPQISAKYAIGSTVKCRVLSCIAFKKSVNFTAKPSLVNEDGMNIFCWNTPRNIISSGVIYKINDVMGYVVVHFYNAVTGVIGSRDLKQNGYLKQPSEEFYIGQTLKVRVVNCKPKNRRMICSLNLNVIENEGEKGKSTHYDRQVFWTKIVSKKDGYFLVKKMVNYDEEQDENEEEEDDGMNGIEHEISFRELNMYSILPFDHLCDNSTQSNVLVDSKAFDVGDKIQVYQLNRVNIHAQNIEKELYFHENFVESIGLDAEILQYQKTNKKILSIVSAKTSLLWLHKKHLIRQRFPTNSKEIRIGDVLFGYISSEKMPGAINALWIHFGRSLELPVGWRNLHDLFMPAKRKCVNASFGDDEHNENEYENLDIYKAGDLVMAKVTDVSKIKDSAFDFNHIRLDMRPSQLLADLSFSRLSFFCKTFINEWYLSYKQNQALFVDRIDVESDENEESDDDSDSDEEMDDIAKEQTKQHEIASLEALNIGMVLKCKVSDINEEKLSVFVEFIPSMDRAEGVIKIKKEQIKIYKKRFTEHYKFKCNVLNIDWSNNECAEIELYDPISAGSDASALCVIQDMNARRVAMKSIIEEAKIIYLAATYVLIEYVYKSASNKFGKRYLGIVPMRMPCLIAPVSLLFRVGYSLQVQVIATSIDYGGITLCSITRECLKRYTNKCNAKMKEVQRKEDEEKLEQMRQEWTKNNDDGDNSNNNKRKLADVDDENNNLHPAKRQKISRSFDEIIKSAKGNILGTVYSAKLIESDLEKQHFIIYAAHSRLDDIDRGILPFEQLCDDHSMSMNLASAYNQILKNDTKKNKVLKNIRVIIRCVTDDNLVIFSAKNMIVSHCANRSFPRFNAYQIKKKYSKIKRNVQMIGTVDENTSKNNDELSIFHGDNVHSIVDYDNALMLPFDRSEIINVYPKGQSVIGQIENNCKIKQGSLTQKLCKFNKIEKHDIIQTNKSFFKEFQTLIRAKSIQNKGYFDDVHIGNVMDVTLTKVSPTLIEFVSLNGKRNGFIIRPEHSGAEIEECFIGMKTQILVIDIDYAQNKIFGSIRLSAKSPDDLNKHEMSLLLRKDSVLCQLEWISIVNGYFVLQMVTNNHLIIVPFKTPYFHFTFTQIYNLYFEIGTKFKVCIIEKIASKNNLFSGHIPSLIKETNGYLNGKMLKVIGNPTKYYKPYDRRFSHPAQIIYSKQSIKNLMIKLVKTTSQGHIGEIAPNFYPKIVISAPNEDDEQEYENYLILEDKVDRNEMIKINVSIQMKKYSNANREIVINANDVIMDEEESEQINEEDDVKMRGHINNDASQLRVGQIVDIRIQKVTKDGINANILCKDIDEKQGGFIEAIHSSDSIEEIQNLQSNQSDLEQNDECKAVIVDISNKSLIQLSVQQSVIQKYQKLQHLLTYQKKLPLDIGQEINGFVTKIVAEHGLFIDLGIFGIAELHITNIADAEDDFDCINLKEMFSINQIIKTRVLSISDAGIINLSIRHLKQPNFIESPLKYEDVISGSMVKGIVSMIDEKLGVIVWISRFIKGRISFANMRGLANKKVSYNAAVRKFPIGTVIKNLSVLFVSSKQRRIELKLNERHKSFKSNRNQQKDRYLAHRLDQMDVGDFVTVKFQKKLSNGALSVFVPSSDFKYAQIPKEQISAHLFKNNNLNRMIKGDKIQCWLFEIKPDHNDELKVYFTMKADAVKLDDSNIDFTKLQIAQIQKEKRRKISDSLMRQYEKLQKLKENEANADEDSDDDDIKPLNLTKSNTLQITLPKSQKIENDDDEDEEYNDDDVVMAMDDDINAQKQKKKVASTEKLVSIQRDDVDYNDDENDIEWTELMKSEGVTSKPNKPKDFERLLVASPDSSIIWIQYIAFYLTKKNVVKARSLIQRALKQITVSEDKERLNVWIAWMNLELLYGSEDALISVFKSALQSNDKRDVYVQFVGVCQSNKKYEICHKYYGEMLHKFETDAIVYANYGAFLYSEFMRTKEANYLDEARDLLKRAIQNLKNKSQHVSMIQKFAWYEYKYLNNLQRSVMTDAKIKNEGETMFEGLLRKHSNKTALWNMYALAVYRFGNKRDGDKLQNARNIFERGLAPSQNINKKKMKMQDTKRLFKKYLEFENKYGVKAKDHQQNVAHIKQLAKQYVMTLNLQKQQQKK